LAYSVVWALLLHALWTMVAAKFDRPVDFAALLALLLGSFGQNNAAYQPTVLAVTTHPGWIASYFLTLYTDAAASGWALHKAVRALQLDLRWSWLRFRDVWWYRLSGEIVLLADKKTADKAPSGVLLSTVVDHGKGSFLYWGLVEDWAYNTEGELDTILVSFAHRRPLEKDARGKIVVSRTPVTGLDQRYYRIRGDYFVLQYSEMRTLNLEYFWVRERPRALPLQSSPPKTPAPNTSP
jgi:hypothetical protein